MTENRLVSIIVPVYKVQAYLDRCIQSLIFQTYKQIEIILVDDGSPDACPRICESWREKDSRIKVIHKENGGLSSARNEGLKAAGGDYILFVDSDDWISLVMVEKMMTVMEKYNVDMVTCQFFNVYPDGYCRKNWNCSDDIKVYTPEKAISLLLMDGEITNHVWRRLYKRKLIWKDPFPVGKNFEDIFISYKLIMQCRQIAVMDEAYYYYFRNEAGIVAGISLRDIEDRYAAFCERERELKEHYPGLRDDIMVSRLKDDYYLWEDINYRLSDRKTAGKKARRMNTIVRKDICSNKSALKKGSRKIALFCFLILYMPFFNKLKPIGSKVIQICHYLFDKKEWEFYHKLGKEAGIPCFYILAAPEYGNLGDQALLKAEKMFAEAYFPEYHVICIPYSKLGIYGRHYLRTHVKEKDILCLQAGGNIGTLYLGIHELQEKVIWALRNKNLTIFPQTFYYAQTEEGNRVLEETARIYGKCRDIRVAVRDRVSYDFVRKNFKVQAYYLPDMALFLHLQRSVFIREGVLLCMRNDAEKSLMGQDRERLLGVVSARFQKIEEADTYLAWDPDPEQMQIEMKRLFDRIAAVRLMITDRLHGMVFAALTETPCVVLISKSYKTQGVYQWIEHLDYIKLVDNLDELENALETVCSIENPVYDVECLKPHWDELARIIRREM